MAMKNLIKATELAEICEVDLKTIHNWANKGEIEHFRTPGRHLRFKPEAVVGFLRQYGYPVPAELAAQVDAPASGTAA